MRLSRAVFSASVLVSCFALAESKEASQGQKEGLARYSIQPHWTGNGGSSVELFDSSSQSVGTLEVSPSESAIQTATLRKTGLALTVVIDPARYTTTIRVGGDEARITFDPKTKKFNVTDPAGLTKKFDKEIKQVHATLADIAPTKPPAGILKEGAQGCAATKEGEGSQQALVGCYGYWQRGTAYGNSRSIACYYAQGDASWRCSNQYCWGCCFYLSCDAYCWQGDYACYAGISGRSCG